LPHHLFHQQRHHHHHQQQQQHCEQHQWQKRQQLRFSSMNTNVNAILYTMFRKSNTLDSVITSANEDRFSKFLHRQIPNKIHHATVKELSTSPEQ